MKILISRPDKIGDVLLSLHGVKQLKQRFPESEIYMHVAGYTADLVRNINFVDGVITLDDDLTKYQFDVVVDLMAKNQTSKLYNLPNIRVRIGNSARWFRYRYNRTRYIRRSRALINEAEYNWLLMSLVDSSLKNTTLSEQVNLSDFRELPDLSAQSGPNCVTLMPGISVSAQGWPLENWIELAEIITKRSDKSVAFILGPAEKSIEAKLQAVCNNSERLKVCSFSDIKQLTGFLASAHSYIGPSTGVTHIAAAVGLSGVALYPEQRSMHPRRWMPFHSRFQLALLSRNPTAEHIFELWQGNRVPQVEDRPAPISAFVVCKNEERNIRRCLESLKWCDDIIVVDSGSTDRTVEICQEYTNRIYFREWNGHREQKQHALDLCNHDWVVHLDSDEECSMELRGQIQALLHRPEAVRNHVSGFLCSRLVFYMNRWWEKGGWYPEYRLRVFRKSHTHWGGTNPHDKAIVKGRVRKIDGCIYHFTYSDMKHQIECLNNHSSNSARALHADGLRSNLFKILFNPTFRFFKFYVLKRGFLEGRPGLVVGLIEAYYTFLKYAKLWELQELPQGGALNPADNNHAVDSTSDDSFPSSLWN